MNAQNGEIILLPVSRNIIRKFFHWARMQPDNKKLSNRQKKSFYRQRHFRTLYSGLNRQTIFCLRRFSEEVIDPNKKILSTGSISIPNPYFPDQKTVFKDWRVNGWVNMMEAIAVSCDVYFYEIGGGYQDQKGLGIANIEKYAKLFGFGEKTGVDLPDEK